MSDEERFNFGWMIGDRYRFDPENVDAMIANRAKPQRGKGMGHSETMEMFEELANQKRRIEELEAQLAQRDAPVSDEEWQKMCGFPIKEGAWVEWRNKIDALIANRAKPQKEGK